MNRLILTLVLLALPLTGNAKTPRPETRTALIDAALDAIKTNDVPAYLALFLSLEEATGHCPEMVADPKMAELIRGLHKAAEPMVRKKLNHCHEIIDFSKARRLRVEGGERKSKPEKGCKDLYELQDILVYLTVGEKTFRVMIDDPFVMGTESYGVMDDPRCREEKAD